MTCNILQRNQGTTAIPVRTYLTGELSLCHYPYNKRIRILNIMRKCSVRTCALINGCRKVAPKKLNRINIPTDLPGPNYLIAVTRSNLKIKPLRV